MNNKKIKQVESLLSEAKKTLNEAVSSEEGEEQVEKSYDRERYLSAFEKTCEKYGLSIELEEDRDRDKVYSEWSDHVNMSASDLKKWSKNPCSREASVDPAAVIRRNLRLLEKNKDDWTSNDFEDAERTISFISRMKANKPAEPREGPHGCPSEWAISLLNWAFNPFSSVPTPSSEVKEDLDPVEEITLQDDEDKDEVRYEDGEVDYEFSPVPDHVVYADIEDAMARAESMGLDGVHEHVLVLGGEEVTMYMPGSEHADWARKVNHPRQLSDEEMSETRQASQVVHGNQEKMKKKGSGDGTESVRVPPVAIHKVEGGASKKVDDDVEKVLDELWEN